MYRVPPAGRWWPAVDAPLERGVRQRSCRGAKPNRANAVLRHGPGSRQNCRYSSALPIYCQRSAKAFERRCVEGHSCQPFKWARSAHPLPTIQAARSAIHGLTVQTARSAIQRFRESCRHRLEAGEARHCDFRSVRLPTGLHSCCLTFELSGRRRQDASARTVKIYRVPPAGRWWPAVGAPLERGVRQRSCRGARLKRADAALWQGTGTRQNCRYSLGFFLCCQRAAHTVQRQLAESHTCWPIHRARSAHP